MREIYFIAHRGNIDGADFPFRENLPEYVSQVVNSGYYAEVDVWYVETTFYLGHDEPTYEISESFLENDKLFCHAKNLDAFYKMLENNKIHCFWHENDKVALTSWGYVWKYPEVYYNSNLWGICSDKF